MGVFPPLPQKSRAWHTGHLSSAPCGWSVCRRELLPDVAGILEFVDQGDGVIFGGDFALSLVVGHEPRSSQAELAGALPRFDHGGGTEIGPVEVGILEHWQHVAMG